MCHVGVSVSCCNSDFIFFVTKKYLYFDYWKCVVFSSTFCLIGKESLFSFCFAYGCFFFAEITKFPI